MPVKKTKITIETRERWIFHRPQRAPYGWCAACEAQVEMATPEEAALVTGATLRQIFRQIEQAQLHFVETPQGGVLLCLPSLAAGIVDGSADG
jgi:hypothetical protein